jgi:hypothetical protein
VTLYVLTTQQKDNSDLEMPCRRYKVAQVYSIQNTVVYTESLRLPIAQQSRYLAVLTLDLNMLSVIVPTNRPVPSNPVTDIDCIAAIKHEKKLEMLNSINANSVTDAELLTAHINTKQVFLIFFDV